MWRHVESNLGIAVDGAASSTTDTTSLIDTSNLWGADDEHNNKQVLIYETTDGNAPQGEKRIVSDYSGSAQDATLAAFTATITKLDKYEMLDTPWKITDLDNAIEQVLMARTQDCPQIKEDSTIFTESGVRR